MKLSVDTLSGGRVRLGLGWQEAKYEGLGEDFHTRGARMDEAIALLRAYWGDARVDSGGRHSTRSRSSRLTRARSAR